MLELWNANNAAFDNVCTLEDRLCFRRGWDLTKCLQSFGSTLKVLQNSVAIERVTYELCLDLAADGVVYGEVLYVP